MKKIKSITSAFISRLIPLIPNQILAILLSFAIKERMPNGKDQFSFKNKSNRYSILALDSDRYRGDIKILSQSNKFRVLHIRQGWQRLLIGVFLKGKNYIYDVENAVKGSILDNQHKKTQLLMNDLLARLYKIIKVDCVTTVHFKYIPDYYWIDASEKLNVPCVMLYRECNLMSPIIFDMVLAMMLQQKSFKGSHVIVHNQKTKEAFIKSNFFDDKKITVASALRMDSLIQMKNEYIKGNLTKNKKTNRKKFTLFYFPVNSSMFGTSNSSINIKEYYANGDFWSEKERYFIQLHQVILKLAEKNSNIDFVIKPKEIFMHDKSWTFYEKVVAESGVNVQSLDNYFVDAHADVHSLIIESDIICGGQSSTTVESLFVGKQVLLPLFCNYKNTDYFEQFPWREYIDLFNVVKNPLEFENYFYDEMLKPSDISTENMKRRTELYLECFEDLNGNAEEMYTKTIVDVINQSKVSH